VHLITDKRVTMWFK